MSQHYDVVIIGGGPGGYVAAIRCAQLGMKTACIEKRNALGGTCLNIGCIPSKALLDSSEHFYHAKTKLQKHGVMTGVLQLDLNQMMKRKDEVVKGLTQGIAGLFKKNKIDTYWGFGKLVEAQGAQKQIEIKTETGVSKITASKVILATGSEVIELPNLKFDGKKIISSTEALELRAVPKHLVIIGAGYIGLEMGSVWARLGAKVTVLEFQDRFLPTMDQQVAAELQKALTKQGLEIRLATKCLGARLSGTWILVDAEDLKTGTKSTIEADVVLVSAGRRPYTDQLGLETCGIQTEKGRVKIDSHFQTNVPGVYAIGDIVAGPMLAHKAEEEGVAIAELLAGQAGHVNYDAIPGVVYTWPELASVGQTEEQLKEKGIAYKVGTFPFMANGRAKAMDETDGMVKVIADATTDRVLGVHIIGPRASDMIAEAVSVMEFGGSAEDIARTCHAHPTLSEALKEAAMGVGTRRIHF
jgi:dihydrolipoamide dehydrogenase